MLNCPGTLEERGLWSYKRQVRICGICSHLQFSSKEVVKGRSDGKWVWEIGAESKKGRITKDNFWNQNAGYIKFLKGRGNYCDLALLVLVLVWLKVDSIPAFAALIIDSTGVAMLFPLLLLSTQNWHALIDSWMGRWASDPCHSLVMNAVSYADWGRYRRGKAALDSPYPFLEPGLFLGFLVLDVTRLFSEDSFLLAFLPRFNS